MAHTWFMQMQEAGMTQQDETTNRQIAEAAGYRLGTADYYNPGGEYEAPAVLRPDGRPVQLYADQGLHALSIDEQWEKAARMADHTDHTFDRPIRDGEIAYDVANDWFYNRAHRYLLDDGEQMLMRQWRREGRIVVDGETVRLAKEGER